MSGCMSAANFEKRYDDWVGFNIKELTSAWGKPQIINSTPNGENEYGYNLSISKSKPLPETCILYFITNDRSIIESMRHEGNRCKAAPSWVRGIGG